MVRRSAFTMIELIFAIVIIAISVLSLPMINQVVAKNMEGSIAQEAIFAASAELNQVVSYYWDENSMEGAATLSRVAWDSDCNSSTKLRPGHINQPYHRRCTDATTGPTTSFGLEVSDGGTPDDLDDVSQDPHSIFVNPGGSATGYKNTYDSEFSITYADFGDVVAGDKSIKRISVTISDSSTGDTVTSLSTFSSNIGEIDYYKRSY